MTTRTVLLVVNGDRQDARELAAAFARRFRDAGIAVRVSEEDAAFVADTSTDIHVVPANDQAAAGCELVVSLGGDGTILRAAERSREHGVPILGVNLGHVGFLAEAESEAAESVVAAVVSGEWTVEERMTLDVRVLSGGRQVASTWAVNEISVEKVAREHMVSMLVEIDGRPLSTWGCDGVVCATPTGSTAYAFSAGGPVVWPELSAILVVPLSAHALFARPLVVSPKSVVAFELAPTSEAVLHADGRRLLSVSPSARIEVRNADRPVRFARIVIAPFTDRLVAKFDLPVAGWRGRRD